MSELMLNLANNYQLGIGIISVVLIVFYVWVSVLAILKRRSVYGDFSLLCMIPLVGCFLYLGAVLKSKKSKSSLQDTNEELIEDIF